MTHYIIGNYPFCLPSSVNESVALADNKINNVLSITINARRHTNAQCNSLNYAKVGEKAKRYPQSTAISFSGFSLIFSFTQIDLFELLGCTRRLSLILGNNHSRKWPVYAQTISDTGERRTRKNSRAIDHWAQIDLSI